MASDGFFKLGEALLGGGIDREGAYLEGANVGSQVSLRRAQTQNALAQARQRVQEAEANMMLGDALKAAGLDPALAPILQAGRGSDFNSVMTGRETGQTMNFRDVLADPTRDAATRQGAGLALRGEPIVAGDVFGPGGELTLPDLFAGTFDPRVTVTGTAQIGADEALAQDRLASAELDRAKAANPAAFRSGITINSGGQGLGDMILEDIGESTIPADIRPEEATGILGLGKSVVNTAFDIANAGLPYPDADQAHNALGDLMTRTQIVGQQGVPGRPSNYLMEQLAVFGVTPNDPFRGDERSLNRMRQTSSFLGGEIDRLRRQLNAGRMTPSKVSQFEDALRNLAALKQDYDVVVSRFNANDAEGAMSLPDGWSVTKVD